jgi:hypothetical protein
MTARNPAAVAIVSWLPRYRHAATSRGQHAPDELQQVIGRPRHGGLRSAALALLAAGALASCSGATTPAGVASTGTRTAAGSALATPAPPTSAPSLTAAEPTATFRGEGFTFHYPARWNVLSGYEHAGLHGPTVLAAVGLGGFDLGCSYTSTSVGCGAPIWTVPDDGVVLAYHIGAWLGPVVPYPTPTLGPGDTWATIGGRPAVLSRLPRGLVYQLPGAPESIEARWGAADADQARAGVEAVIASWTWSSP